MDTLPKTDRSRVRRYHDRGTYDREKINTILDSQPLCSVGYVIEGKPFVTPTLQWREGDHVYWHGSSASRALRKSSNAEVCISVSILDGFVLARSGFHHSVNSRSVNLFGEAFKIEGQNEKREKLKNFVDGLFPGRFDALRKETDLELKATTILGMKISEGSAKIRSGDSVEDEEDYNHAVWAGIIPIELSVGQPIPDPRNVEGVKTPEYVLDFKFE